MERSCFKVDYGVNRIINRVEKAKPSYLERIAEEKARKEMPEEKQEIIEEKEETEREPLSGIANTIMIRKSKRKFLVVSLNPLCCDENGNALNSEEASHHQSIPQTVEVPISQKQEEGTPKSTKK